MATIDEAADLFEAMAQLEPHVHVAGAASEAAILELERVFGRPMPPSYRQFLERFGSASILNTVYSGIRNGQILGEMGLAMQDTLRDRERWHLPAHYLVIEPNEDGPMCLDFS